jgi:hypothetical protein
MDDIINLDILPKKAERIMAELSEGKIGDCPLQKRFYVYIGFQQ